MPFCISKAKVWNLPLEIETGSWKNVVGNRLCELCHTEVEDKYHFMFRCNQYLYLYIIYNIFIRTNTWH